MNAGGLFRLLYVVVDLPDPFVGKGCSSMGRISKGDSFELFHLMNGCVEKVKSIWISLWVEKATASFCCCCDKAIERCAFE
jgi:hypothetical protein